MHSLGHYFNPHATLENKLGLAGASYELAASLPHVPAYLASAAVGGWAAIVAHEATLQGLLLEYLRGRAGDGDGDGSNVVTIHGSRSADPAVRVPTVSFTVEGWDSAELVRAVGEPWAFRWGAFYSNRLVGEVLGLGGSGVVRVSMVHYNTGKWGEREIERGREGEGERRGCG